MKDSEVLGIAADVIENGFGKDGYALDKDGMRVGVMAEDAVNFCLVGATARVLGGSIHGADDIVDKWLAPLLPKRPPRHDPYIFLMYDARPIVEEDLPRITPRTWNDDPSRTKEQVAGKLREASAAAAKEGK